MYIKIHYRSGETMSAAASYAMSTMYAYEAAAGCARPFGYLPCQKGIHTFRFDLKQVIHHAHTVFFPVSFIQML
jgi:hypothetical protein